jgi:hypothetical protein
MDGKLLNRFWSCISFLLSRFHPFPFSSRTFKNGRLKSGNESRTRRDFPSRFRPSWYVLVSDCQFWNDPIQSGCPPSFIVGLLSLSSLGFLWFAVDVKKCSFSYRRSVFLRLSSVLGWLLFGFSLGCSLFCGRVVLLVAELQYNLRVGHKGRRSGSDCTVASLQC